MTGYEANYYSLMIATLPRIAKALERIADALEKEEKKGDSDEKE
jgi:hypothetical protein